MTTKTRKYFTFFGILAATVNRKISSLLSSMHSILNNVPKIVDILLSTQLKPVKTYSTNNLK
ncbi:MAG: hypothetical protein ACNI3C_10340 [Candidatus Marinarcus sp.]|uniref:hypothetical protein n=1 Tax=Candidatus Marinarcus sp. TaxID=3100987 RepID=UPI003AFF8AA4